MGGELAPKRLELLHELLPDATVMAVLVYTNRPGVTVPSLKEAARTLGLQLHVLNASTERDFDTVFATVPQLHAGGLVIAADAFFTTRSEQLAALAFRHRVPRSFSFASSRRLAA